jgi:hypothetical protein
MLQRAGTPDRWKGEEPTAASARRHGRRRVVGAGRLTGY